MPLGAVVIGTVSSPLRSLRLRCVVKSWGTVWQLITPIVAILCFQSLSSSASATDVAMTFSSHVETSCDLHFIYGEMYGMTSPWTWTELMAAALPTNIIDMCAIKSETLVQSLPNLLITRFNFRGMFWETCFGLILFSKFGNCLSRSDALLAIS